MNLNSVLWNTLVLKDTFFRVCGATSWLWKTEQWHLTIQTLVLKEVQ